MSATLGPIHGIVYNKILLQEQLARRVAAAAEVEITALDTAAPAPREGQLADLIDLSNIHGWLAAHLENSEKCLAAAIAAARQAGKWQEALEAAKTLGAERAPAEPFPSAGKAYFALTSTLADGMPCDRALLPTEETQQRVLFTRQANVHAPHLQALGVDSALYDNLRDAFLEGWLPTAGYRLLNLGAETFSLEKEN